MQKNLMLFLQLLWNYTEHLKKFTAYKNNLKEFIIIIIIIIIMGIQP